MLQLPVLYLSAFLKRHRTEYYDRLMAIRDQGDWEGWLGFFLSGVVETAEEASLIARAILDLRAFHQVLLQDQGLERHGFRLLDLLFRRPVLNVRLVERDLGVTFRTANDLLARFTEIEIVTETTGGKRNRRFRYAPYLALFVQPDVLLTDSMQEPKIIG